MDEPVSAGRRPHEDQTIRNGKTQLGGGVLPLSLSLSASGAFGGVSGAGVVVLGGGLVFFGGELELVQPSTAMLQPKTTAISLFIGLVLSLVPRRTLYALSPPVLDA